MPIAAHSATDRVDQLITLTTRLTGIIREELSLLAERRPSDLIDTTAERDKLTAVYAQEMALIRRDQSLIEGARADLLQTLKSVTAEFRAALKDHTDKLNAIRSVSEGMIKAVAEQAQSKTQAITGYGKDAGMRHTRTAPTPSLALNQVI